MGMMAFFGCAALASGVLLVAIRRHAAWEERMFRRYLDEVSGRGRRDGG